LDILSLKMIEINIKEHNIKKRNWTLNINLLMIKVKKILYKIAIIDKCITLNIHKFNGMINTHIFIIKSNLGIRNKYIKDQFNAHLIYCIFKIE